MYSIFFPLSYLYKAFDAKFNSFSCQILSLPELKVIVSTMSPVFLFFTYNVIVSGLKPSLLSLSFHTLVPLTWTTSTLEFINPAIDSLSFSITPCCTWSGIVYQSSSSFSVTLYFVPLGKPKIVILSSWWSRILSPFLIYPDLSVPKK